MVFTAAFVILLGVVIPVPQKDCQYKLFVEKACVKEIGKKTSNFLFFLPWFVGSV